VSGHRVGNDKAGRRLDALLAELEPELSRAQIQRAIAAAEIKVEGRSVKPSHRVHAGEWIELQLGAPTAPLLEPEPIPLRVVYEDADLIVVDKPAGLVVHPSPGHASGTLVHALLHHCRDLSGVGGELRPGIVHRLDKGTSGLIVAAKHDRAHRHLALQFREHSIDREYLALVRGRPRATSGSVDAAIGRHPSDRKRFSTRVARGRSARTHWSVERRFADHTLLRVRLETGRTHQIRVHLSSVGLPIAGDPVYGGGRKASALPGLTRPALHAALLGFEQPRTGERLRLYSELPEDLSRVLSELEP